MSNFLNFFSTFLFVVANLIGRHQDHLPIMYTNVASCLLAYRSQRNGIQIKSKLIGPLHASQIWKHIHWAYRYMNALNTFWTPPECLWVRVNTNEWVGTAPEHPLSVHECHWVSVNTHWVRMNTIESLLNATHHGVTLRKISFVWELTSPWLRLSACECLRVSIEYPLNAGPVQIESLEN